ncbi:SRPBCC family protein [Hoyosella sp. G463]|uniref:SRPBCC family protein n=1 Tax=Lolliginicoccus lacisalsi TaxID=2742202 RepID=A0A927JC89_9ACTN|nr:SRPBCC family protein [Lolliginicoccus lacisalsi]MBD8506458.1 SRPBCC family protein [Lolliginicoccus lacisalsi]
MASTLRTSATPHAIWNVLNDAWLYAGWVVGSSRIRDVDPQWPRPGTRFHHSFGAWPLVNNDFTEVVSQVPGKSLELVARTWPLGKARVRVTINELDHGSEITLEEWIITAPAKWIPRRVQEELAAPRNKECLRRLALIAEGRGA